MSNDLIKGSVIGLSGILIEPVDHEPKILSDFLASLPKVDGVQKARVPTVEEFMFMREHARELGLMLNANYLASNGKVKVPLPCDPKATTRGGVRIRLVRDIKP